MKERSFRLLRVFPIMTLVVIAMSVAAAETYPEKWSVEKLSFPPAPHRVYINDTEFFGGLVTGRVVVFDPDEMRFLGMVPFGFAAPMVLSKDKRVLYTADAFYSRGVRGDRADFITAHDTSTLAPLWEISIPSKRATNNTEVYQFTLSDDERFALAMNRTPATSVSIVDLKEKKFVNEIPIAGCALNYPAGPRRFASICGDGNLLLVSYDDKGKETARDTVKLFDPDTDLVIERAVALGSTYYFVSYSGDIYSIDLGADKPVANAVWPLLSDAEKAKKLKPGGWQLLAISPAKNLLFALIHKDGYRGSHKDPSTDVWIYDLATKKKIGQMSSNKPMWSLHATSDENPLLFATNLEGGIEIFDINSKSHKATREGLLNAGIFMLSH
jgi:methylamine dehydrogenase heavy chain